MADQFCYVCGDVGYAELIVTCFKCKVVREHLYCMPSKSHDVPKSWLCGNCTLDEAKSPDDSGLQAQAQMPLYAKTGKVKFLPTEEVIKLSSGGMKGPSKSNTATATPKTSTPRKVFENPIPRPLFQASKECQERNSATVPPKVCGVKKQALATCLPRMPVGPIQTLKKVKVSNIPASVSRHGLPVANKGKEVPSPSTKLEDARKQMKDALMTQERHTHGYGDNTEKEVPSPSTKWEDTHKQMKEALMTHERHTYGYFDTGKEVPSPSTKLEDAQKQMKDALMTQERHTHGYGDTKEKEVPSPSTNREDTHKQMKEALMIHERHAYGYGDTGKEVPSPSTKLKDTQKQMKDAFMIQAIHTYRAYLPALHASWKGGFHFVDTRMAGEFYGGFLAKPPGMVHGRAYELSRKIPSILKVKLLSRSDIWDDLFHDECPDLADIALYFFPCSNIERSRQNNSYLFELMEREDLLIRSLIEDAELVVFTSRQLELHSQYVVNRLNAECLLFGVFHAIKDHQCTPVVPMLEYGSSVSSVECASRVSLLECMPNGRGKHNEVNSVNKEFDIMVENTSGKSPPASQYIDSTIQRLLLEFGSPKARESDVNALTKDAQTKNREPEPIAAIGSYCLSFPQVKTEPLPVIKLEGSDDKKYSETEHCLRMVPTFSVNGSQNRTGLIDQDFPKRVADKYLQIFHTGIKKERR